MSTLFSNFPIKPLSIDSFILFYHPDKSIFSGTIYSYFVAHHPVEFISTPKYLKIHSKESFANSINCLSK